MKQPTQTMLKTLSVAMMLVGANAAMAETVTVPATVAVNNAIDFSFTGTLDFGTLRATAAAAVDDCRVLTMSADPTVTTLAPGSGSGTLMTTCATPTVASALASVGGTIARPVFTIASVAPYATLQLTLPSTPIKLSGPGFDPSTDAQFTVGDFTAWRTSGITPGAVTTAIQANNLGTATFLVGASIATDNKTTMTGNYQDGAPYTGTFDVEVSY
jgi:hypothetical protein